ncbi:FAD-dependent oxidoreductase [Spirosoma aureum]|uniref:FAD-dependent oxidoreductase n=1 Tax=Spirosoma aureum TaxID=2692134 RepID=A0A6G9ARH5_9BACT|nr:FAD-dependent oxidoreductase [Spirosoma aureum]QIP14929.1 FAD-dependent oxidoreductase [Spirosoma aureum]
MRYTITICLSLLLTYSAIAQQQVDICVYGGTSGGVIAAFTARKAGKTVILIEPGKHLGGMTSGGLGLTDIGNKYAITGLARDYYRRIGQHYGKFEQWIFEPHVAEDLFSEYVKRGQIDVLLSHRLSSVKKSSGQIQEIVLENSDKPLAKRTIRAKMFIDCSYEGDLMAKAGVSYTVGREDNSKYNETISGVQLMTGHQLPDGIDPYKTPGNPDSGLVWGVSPAKLEPNGTGDNKAQAYNYRICLSSDPANQVAITRPAGYDSTKYELLVRLIAAQPQKRSLNDYFIWSGMPNKKTDINNRNGFSTDMIGMNYGYPDGSYEKRAQIIRDHELYTKGLLYFFGHDSRVPQELRDQMLKWGYPKDEYTDTGNWSPQLYIREARRMVGAYVMTQANCQGKEVVTDGVGMAAYTMDSHNIQRIVIEKDGKKMAKNEGNVEVGGFGPYPISYRALIPKENECQNLLVPVCLSASHIAYGSIRMEPVFMVLGQSTALAAAMAIDAKTSVQKVNIAKLQQELKANPLADGSTPEILVDNDSQKMTTITGPWRVENKSKGGYGPSYLIYEGQGEEKATVRFTPDIVKAGKYRVYAYFPRLAKSASELGITVSDGKSSKSIPIKTADIVVVGQTSGEWVALGDYELPKGQASSVEIAAKQVDGPVVADAVLFVPAF